MVDYGVVGEAARQIFVAKKSWVHPFFHPYVDRVFELSYKTHKELSHSADTEMDVLNDNFGLMQETIQLCQAMDQVRANSNYCGFSSEWTKIGSAIALNGKLMAALMHAPDKNGVWLFERSTDAANQIETARFVIKDDRGCMDPIVFEKGPPNDYARHAIMAGLECLEKPTPVLWKSRSCVADFALTQTLP